MTVPPLPSPLKRVNTAGLRPKSKLESEWDKWSTVPDLFSSSRGAEPGPDEAPIDPKRYFNEFFCLAPNRNVQRQALDKLSVDDLVGSYADNVAQLFKNAIVVLRDAPRDDVRRSNVTLTVLLKNLVEREYADPPVEITNLLVGGADNVDKVFTDLVSTIDSIIQDSELQVTLRHSTLQLALFLVSSLGVSPATAFFLRRDLFSSLVSFISDPRTQQYTFEASLLIGLLANYRKCEVKNAYRTRIEDFVEEEVMSRIIDLVQTVLVKSRDEYLSVADDAPPTLVSSLTSLVFNLNLSSLLVNPFAWSLPPAPDSKPNRAVENMNEISSEAGLKVDLKGKGRATEDEISDHARSDTWTATPTPNISTPGSISSTANGHGVDGPLPDPPLTPVTPKKLPALPPASSPYQSPTQRPLLRHKASSTYSIATNGGRGDGKAWRKTSDPFVKMPPTTIAILLPFYEFLSSNKTFGSLVFSSRGDTPPPLPRALISLSSYILCHASTSHRAQLYSRLALALLMLLVEESEGGKLTTKNEEPVRLCRQRTPTLQSVVGERPLVASVLDSVVLFLRHNLKKRLDVEPYTVSLQLLQRTMQQLRADKVRLEYDWVTVWRSILSLSSFVVTHIKDLRKQSDRVDDLISQIFVTTSYAVYWGEQLLPSATAQAHLYYELLHSDSILSSLSDLLGISSLAGRPYDSPSSPPRLRGVEPVSPLPKFYFFGGGTSGTSPEKPSFGSPTQSIPLRDSRSNSLPAGTGAGFVATECISNIRSTLSFFHSLIAKHSLVAQDASGDPLEPREILAIIERNLAGVELIESAAMGDLGGKVPGSSEVDGFQRDLFEVMRQDTKALLTSDFATQ
ncbi:hypothetical protein JCM10212_000693 [Sporobolomyces blumeae]